MEQQALLPLPEKPSEVWEMLQTMFNERELRLVYLLYNCGLSPQEIRSRCPQEWYNLQEIYDLRGNILTRLLFEKMTSAFSKKLIGGEVGSS